MSEAKAMPQLTCKVCGYEWTPRTPNPKVCPSCKHRDWNKTRWQPGEEEKK